MTDGRAGVVAGVPPGRAGAGVVWPAPVRACRPAGTGPARGAGGGLALRAPGRVSPRARFCRCRGPGKDRPLPGPAVPAERLELASTAARWEQLTGGLVFPRLRRGSYFMFNFAFGGHSPFAVVCLLGSASPPRSARGVAVRFRDLPCSDLGGASRVRELSLLRDRAALATLLLKIVRNVRPNLGGVRFLWCGVEATWALLQIEVVSWFGGFGWFWGFFCSVWDFAPKPYERSIDYSESLL